MPSQLSLKVLELENELNEARQREAATSEVLKIISGSPTDVQPVFEMIVRSAMRLCSGLFGLLVRYDGELMHMVANVNHSPAGREAYERVYPRPATRETATGRAILDRAVITIPDVEQDAERSPATHEAARIAGVKSILCVPMLRDGRPIGAIVVARGEPGPFTDEQVGLLRSFADQAVIAIENTRLFEEVQARTRELAHSLEEQTATSEVLGIISRSPTDLQPVLDSIATTAARLCESIDAQVWRLDGARLKKVAQHGILPGLGPSGDLQLTRGSVSGRAVIDRRTIHVADIAAQLESEYPDAKSSQLIVGHRTTLAAPLLCEGEPLGAITLRRTEVRPFSPRQIELLKTFADQAVIAIENVRLFEGIAQKSRELEIASQHKSQFVANMSHELRTPLAAILGYAELMQEGFYETQGDKSMAALTRIRSNGKHLLGLINTVLDIAKIESGQFNLNLGDYAIESVVETVRAATESLAETKKLALKTDVVKRLPVGFGDEQRLTQVLLNLVGNAIKFTDTGEVLITATTEDGHFAVVVTDTGPGIPPEELKRVFEQFHQIDNSNTKAKGGTGLGLAIAKQIVEMHGGRIWVESTVGKGSTFQMELPIRAEHHKGAA